MTKAYVEASGKQDASDGTAPLTRIKANKNAAEGFGLGRIKRVIGSLKIKSHKRLASDDSIPDRPVRPTARTRRSTYAQEAEEILEEHARDKAIVDEIDNDDDADVSSFDESPIVAVEKHFEKKYGHNRTGCVAPRLMSAGSDI